MISSGTRPAFRDGHRKLTLRGDYMALGHLFPHLLDQLKSCREVTSAAPQKLQGAPSADRGEQHGGSKAREAGIRQEGHSRAQAKVCSAELLRDKIVKKAKATRATSGEELGRTTEHYCTAQAS